MPTTTALLFAACLSLGAAEAADPVKQGLDYLVSAQDEEGFFPDNYFGRTDFRRGITALGVLALLAKGEDKYDAAARKALQFLAENQEPDWSYDHSYAALALVEGAMRWRRDFLPAAKKAVQFIIDNEPVCSSTCKASLMLQIFWSARQAGLHVPDHAIQHARKFIHEHFDAKKKMFRQSNDPDSTHYGATSMAAAALEQWGEKDSKRVVAALSRLDAEPIDKITGDLKGSGPKELSPLFTSHYSPGGYHHFELLACVLAYRHSQNVQLLQSWLPKVRAKLLQQAGKDGSWEGWFGKAYGTAIVCLILQADGAPKLAWLQPTRKSK